jgi:transaldolase
MNRLRQLHDAGVSIWLDTLSRELLDGGGFAELVADCAVTGATSNPTIFAKAITGSDAYDDELQAAVASGVRDPQELFFELALDDVRDAADVLRPTYDASDGRDGFVSFECTPDLADDTAATIAQALELWGRLARPNVMIKVPATEAGIPAIEELTASGVNVNITLLFSVARYEQVIDAYIAGLGRRVAAGQPVDAIASVASFFVSRVDTKADAQLPPDSPLRGHVAIANAHRAYGRYRERFTDERCAAPAPGPNDRSGPAPGPRTPPTQTSSTSRSSSPPTSSTPCPRPRCAHSRTTGKPPTRSTTAPPRPRTSFAKRRTPASTSPRSPLSWNAKACSPSAPPTTSSSNASRPRSKLPPPQQKVLAPSGSPHGNP